MEIQLYWNFKLCFNFFPQNLHIQIEGAAYLWMQLIHGNCFLVLVQSHLNQEEKPDVLDMKISTHLNIVAQNFTKVTIRKLQKNKERVLNTHLKMTNVQVM